jgi:hypothetical protein
MLSARWEALIEIARAEEARYQTGFAHNLHEREAWFNISKIGASVLGKVTRRLGEGLEI